MSNNNITVTISNQPLMDKITQLQQEVSTLEETITSLNTQIADLNQQVEQKQATIDSLNLQISQLQEQVSQLNAQVTALTEQVQTLTLENSQLTQQVGQLQASVQSLNEQITGMINQINTINGETVESPIEYLAQTKSDILTALQSKGSSATSFTTFRQYATEINNLNVTVNSDTLALFHFDNDHGLTDSSAYKWTLSTLTGTPQIDSTMGKFSNGSLYLDGSSALYIDTTDLNPFSYPEWTIEFWIQGDTNGEQWQTVMSQHNYYTPTGGSEITAYYRLNFDGTNEHKLNFDYPNMNNTSSASIGSSTSNGIFYTLGQWHHVALCKNSLDPTYMFRYYLDGVFKIWNTGTPTIYTRGFLPLAQLSTNIYIGTRYYSASNPPYTQYFKGWLNDMRFSKVCRYTTNFTPPTEPFSV